MSWTNECTQSNEFTVKDTKEVKAVLKTLGFKVFVNESNTMQFFGDEGAYIDDYDEVVLSLKPITKEGNSEATNFVGLISDKIADSIDLENIGYNLTEKDVKVMRIIEYLQNELLENQYIVITCAGFDGRTSGNSSPFGDVTVITKNIVKSESLYSITENMKKDLGLAE